MKKDPVVEEIRKHREAHAKRFNYDLRAIFVDLKRQEEEDPRPKADLTIKRRRAYAVAERHAPYGGRTGSGH